MRYLLLILISVKCFAYDQELADRLKEELTHEANRRRAFTQFEEEKKKTEKEQNKGLSLWLEEQEQWDTAREKSVNDYKKTRQPARKMVVDAQGSVQELTKEYYADVEAKQSAQRLIEDGRKQHIQIKKNIIAQYAPTDVTSEEQELGIYSQRPRYDLRKRGKNKWTNSGSKIGGQAGSSGGSDAGFNSGGFQGDTFDFPPPPPATDFVPQDNFDDFPPPPPATDFGNAPGMYDSGFGDAPIPPPPPPPPEGGWDF